MSRTLADPFLALVESTMLAIATLLALSLGASDPFAGGLLTELRASLATDDTPLAGQVVDKDGKPLAGASVVATWDQGAEDATRQSCEAGADGAFSLTHAKELGAPTLTAELDGYRFKSVANAAGAEVQLMGTAVIEVRLDLRLVDGTAPKDAKVRFTSPLGSEIETVPWASPDEPLVVEGKRATATVYANAMKIEVPGDHASHLISAPFDVVREAVRDEPALVELYARDVLKVRVPKKDPKRNRFHGQPVVFARPVSELNGKTAKSALFESLFARGNPNNELPAPPRDGRVYYLFDLEPGEYVVGYAAGAFELTSIGRVHVVEGVTELELVGEDAEERGDFVVRCTGVDGVPLTASGFRSYVKSGNSTTSSSGVRKKNLGPGHYVFSRATIDPRVAGLDDDDEEHVVRLTVLVDGFGAKTVEILDDVDEYNVVFRVPVSLELRFLGAGLEPYYVRMRCPEADVRRAYDLEDLPEDPLEFAQLQGDYFIVEWILAAPDARFMENRQDGGLRFVRGLVVHTDVIDLSRESGLVEIGAPTTYNLDVDASAFGANHQIIISGEVDPRWVDPGQQLGPSRLRTSTDAKGHITFENLGPGTYTLLGTNWTKPLVVTLASDQACVLPRIEANGITVTVEDPFGTLGSMGLRTEDVILGSEDETLDSSSKAYQFRLQCRKTPVVALVERDGQVIEVELDALGMPDTWGGTFEPRFPPEPEDRD